MAYSFVKHSANLQTCEETQLVMTYELARIFDCLFDRAVSELPGYDAFAKSELADYISMIRMHCEQQTWSFDKAYNVEVTVQNILPRANILSKMLVAHGKMIRGSHYIKRFGVCRADDPVKATRDLVGCCRELCQSMHWNFWDVVDLGEVRYEERMKDLREHGINISLKPEFQRH